MLTYNTLNSLMDTSAILGDAKVTNSAIDLVTHPDFVMLVKCLKQTNQNYTAIQARMFDQEYETQFSVHCKEFYWMTRAEQIKSFRMNMNKVPLVNWDDILGNFLTRPEFY